MTVLAMIFWVIVIGIVADTVAKVAVKRGGTRAVAALQTQVEELRQQLAEQSAMLAETDAELSGYAGQLEEMQQRLDFAERLLAQSRKQQQIAGPPM